MTSKPTFDIKSSQILNISVNQGLDFILRHFQSSKFPRRISTKTTQNTQIWVNNKEEALARFKQANYLDCKISAYSSGDIKGDPNFLFIDVDTTDLDLVKEIADRNNSPIKRIGGHPTILFSGSGYHIYQPIDSSSVCLDNIEQLSKYNYHKDLGDEFLRYAEKYLSDERSCPGHNPSLNSCMIRIPGSINSKNGNEVKIIQEWDHQRPSIILLLGGFRSWLGSKQRQQEKIIAKTSKNHSGVVNGTRINWIENNLLNTPLDDYRKTIVNLVLAPYLVNVRRLEFAQAVPIIKEWLQLCSHVKDLDFHPDYLINAALMTAGNSGYKPMRLDTLRQRSTIICDQLGL